MKYFLEQVYLETGLRDINKLASVYKEAEIYFHMDLDGVTSAIAIKEYLKRYNIKTIAAHIIQYGEKEYAINKVSDNTLKVLVDFAHGKTMMNIHTDHHDKQSGVESGVSTSFVKSPSNAAYISTSLSSSDIFPTQDAELISIVDSADFAKRGITIEEVLQTVFSIDREKELIKNKQNLGFVVNKMLLFYKNKKQFLEKIVLQASPSLISMYLTIKNVIKELNLDDPSLIKQRSDNYISTQKVSAQQGSENSVGSIMMLKSGKHIVYDNYAVQYDGGYLMKGGYDRYTIFKNQPQIEIYTMGWSMGLIQISKNPFKKDKSPEVDAINLGEYVQTKLLPKFKDQLENETVSLLRIKEVFEREVTKNKIDKAVGFTMKDFISLFKNSNSIKGINIENKNSFNNMIEDIANKKFFSLSEKQKEMLSKVKISLWDIIQAQSGGHKDITNISGLNFGSKDYVNDLLKPMMILITKDMLKFLNKDKQYDLSLGAFGNLIKPEVRESIGEVENSEVKPLEGKYMSIDDKDGRFKFGTIAEEIVFQHLSKNAPEGVKVENTKTKEGWNSVLDLKFGDIWITKPTGKVIKADVKNGRAITLNSIEKFEGDIYIFVNSRSSNMSDSYVVSANNIKKYCKMLITKDPECVVKLKSGMEGIRIDFKNEAQSLPKMTFDEYITKFKGSI